MFKYLITPFVAITLGGCFAPKETPVQLHEIESFSHSGEHEIKGFFWEEFGDGALNETIKSALAQNLNLKAVSERIAQAEYQSTIKNADKLPNIALSQRVQNSHTLHGVSKDGDTHTISLQATYTLDLFNQIDALAKEAELKRLIAIENHKEAMLSLAAEVSRAWFNIASHSEKELLINEQIDTANKVLESISTRFSVGKADASDVLRQQRELEALKFELLNTKEQKETQTRKLQILSGKSPIESLSATPKLSENMPFPKSGLPLELLQKRPDLRSSFYLLSSKDAKAHDAYFRQYPRVTLGIDIQSSSANLGNLFENWLFNIVGSIAQPIFNAGALKASADSTKSEAKEAAYLYADAYLKAVYEVEDALNVLKFKNMQYENIQNQTKIANEAFLRIVERYNKGASSFLDALSALTTWQKLQRDLISAKLNRTLALITLYRALGVGAEKLGVNNE